MSQSKQQRAMNIMTDFGLNWTLNEPPKGTNYTTFYITEKKGEQYKDMNAISNKELIAEFLERFAVPNFFSKQHVEEAHGDLTDDQWEKFKTDYNHSSSVHSEASKTFVDDVEYMFDANCDYESEDESEDEDEEEVEHNICCGCGKYKDTGNICDCGCSHREKCWTCSKKPATHSTYRDALGEHELTCDECFREEYPEENEEENEDEEQNCPSCKVGERECDCDKCGLYGCYEWDEDEEKLVEHPHCCGCGKYKDVEQAEQKCPLCKVGERDCDCDKCGLYGCYECVRRVRVDGDYPNLCSKCQNEDV